jgi:hypothetical protein
LKQTDISEAHTSSIIALRMEAVSIAETSVHFNKTTLLSIPESCHPFHSITLGFISQIILGYWMNATSYEVLINMK